MDPCIQPFSEASHCLCVLLAKTFSVGGYLQTFHPNSFCTNRLDKLSKETTVVNQIFGGYLQSQGLYIYVFFSHAVIVWLLT